MSKSVISSLVTKPLQMILGTLVVLVHDIIDCTTPNTYLMVRMKNVARRLQLRPHRNCASAEVEVPFEVGNSMEPLYFYLFEKINTANGPPERLLSQLEWDPRMLTGLADPENGVSLTLAMSSGYKVSFEAWWFSNVPRLPPRGHGAASGRHHMVKEDHGQPVLPAEPVRANKVEVRETQRRDRIKDKLKRVLNPVPDSGESSVTFITSRSSSSGSTGERGKPVRTSYVHSSTEAPVHTPANQNGTLLAETTEKRLLREKVKTYRNQHNDFPLDQSPSVVFQSRENRLHYGVFNKDDFSMENAETGYLGDGMFGQAHSSPFRMAPPKPPRIPINMSPYEYYLVDKKTYNQ